jgi:hypothetical protein
MKYSGKKVLKCLVVVGVFICAAFAVQLHQARAGFNCNPNVANSCQLQGFPSCFTCQSTSCVPVDSLCDDGDACTQDTCAINESVGPFGCFHQSLLASAATNLPTECYICEPTANNVSVHNGICDDAAGENCQNDPEDCGIVGFSCGTPSSPLPSLFFVNSSTGNNYDTTCKAGTTLSFNSDVTFSTVSCEDGDRCTQNICTFVAGNYNANDPGVCSNPPITACSPVSDGCCPAGCVGPVFGQSCPVGVTATTCDPDCCSPEVCGNGDSEVQAPETCDDSLPSGEAGINPNGQAVSNAECRDPGTPNECSYCGDGIVDSPTEECDGTAPNNCGTAGCDIATCLCIQQQPGFLEGDGVGISTCSLNKNATMPPAANLLLLGVVLGGLGVGIYLRRRED